MQLSKLADTLIGSEIVKLGGEIRALQQQGAKIYNFTVGDFDPNVFPIPTLLKDEIIKAYQNNFTNYPAAEGNLDLRESLVEYIHEFFNISYTTDELLVAGGGRPLIYAIFRTILDKGDTVLYAVPSWNNNHYTHFVEGKHVLIPTDASTKFMPTAEGIAPFIKEANLLCLCSPQNPTGTTLSAEELKKICDLVLAENQRRGDNKKPVYIMYDQMYSQLTFDGVTHAHPVGVCPAIRPYTIYLDAISKSFAATGVRVGWAFGPSIIISKMKAILTHLGAWAPMAEQKGTAVFLKNKEAIVTYIDSFKKEIAYRLEAIYKGLMDLKRQGYAVDAIAPEAAIYLTIQFDLVGKHTAQQVLLEKQSDVTSYLLKEAGLAIVPFTAFGAEATSNWYRLSVGTCKKEDIEAMLAALRNALAKLQ
ncbi:MAG: pyridoxal phosphate-dependent aminotransferase [Chitinophagia bacterium]|nr:pyridoxal phosphate-dependent aminotransferase [Chitinophagia bacterium]